MGYHGTSRLKEVIGTTILVRWHMTISFCDGGKDGELGLQVFPKVHDRGDVATPVAVVWSAPYRDDGFVVEMPLYAEISSNSSIP